MPVAPDLSAVTAYLGAGAYTADEVTSALASETAAQLRVCRIPGGDEDPYPADLAEALCRRVAHNLALRGLPLGVQANVAEGAVATNRVGGTDAEVARLERPYRPLVIA